MKIYHISYSTSEDSLFVESVRVKAIDYIEAINIFTKQYPNKTILGIMQSNINPATLVGKILSNEHTNQEVFREEE